MGFLDKLKNLIKFAKITGAANNSDQFPVQQMIYKGKTTNVLQIFPYGIYANCSDDCLGVVFSIDGCGNNRAALSYTPKLRPKDLKQNEVAFFHPHSGTFIKLRNNGNIEIDSQESEGDLIINCQNASIKAEGEITLDTSQVNITGNLDVTGNSTAADHLSDGISGKNHTHSGSPTAPDGPVSDTGGPQ